MAEGGGVKNTNREIAEVCPHEWLTCSQEAMSRQHELRRDLHFTVGVMLEGREVGLVFVGVHFFPVPVVGCRGQRDGGKMYDPVCVFFSLLGQKGVNSQVRSS